MRRFYFDIHDGQRTSRDDEGVHFPSLEAARNALMIALGEVTKDVMPGGPRDAIVGEIRDQTGRPIVRATLSLKVESL
jgi:hypothetical protein